MKTILSLIVFLVFSGNVLFAQTASLTVTNATCNGACNGSISSTTTGGTPPYTYLWNNGAIVPNPTGLCAGTYTVTVIDVLGASGIFSATVAQPPVLTAIISASTNVSCYGMCDGNATVTASGGTLPYAYSWFPSGQTIPTATNLCSGVYSVTITDVNNCTVTTSVTITEPAVVAATALNNGPVCEGQMINFTASGGTNYSWIGPNGFTSTIQNPTISGATLAMAGVFSVTVTNAVGCTAVANTTVIVDAAPIVNAGVDQTACSNNPSVNLNGSAINATGGTWSGGGGTYNPNSNTLNATYTPSAGEITTGFVNLTLTTTGNGTCNAVTDQMVISIMPAPTVNAGMDQTVCASNPYVLLNGIISGGSTTGIWTTNGTGTFAPDDITLNTSYVPSAGDIVIGTVNLTLTSTNNGSCNAVTDQVIITILPAPTVNAGIDQTVCNGTSVTLSGSGATSYTWDNGVTNGAPFTPLVTTTYSVTGTDGNGCTNTDQIIVTVNALPIVYAGVDQTVCAGTAVTLSGSGTLTYVWDNGIIDGTPFTALATTTYIVTGIDANGCTNTDTVLVTVNALAILSGTVTYSVGDIPAGDGTVNLFKQSTSGGGQFDSIASQTITSTGYIFNNLMPGNYHISVVLTNPALYPNLLTTYYNNRFLWTDADTIILVCNDNISLPITMYEFVSSPPGNCDLSGTIVYGNYSGFKSTKAVGEPVPGAEILIEQEPNDVPIQSVITDSNGYYLLQNIDTGSNYHLLVDIPGYPLLSTYLNITINNTDTLLNNLNFIFDTSSTGGIFIDTATGFSNLFINSGIVSMNVFPNPFANQLNINFELSQDVDVAVELISINGSQTKELLNKTNCKKGSYNYTVAIPQIFAEGNYLLKIKAGNNVIVKKLILKK